MSATADLTTPADIDHLVAAFYRKVLRDPIIGFFFTDLAQIDPSPQRAGQVADQGAEVDSLRGGEVDDDELVEVTPKTIRLRKRILPSNMRPKKMEE